MVTIANPAFFLSNRRLTAHAVCVHLFAGQKLRGRSPKPFASGARPHPTDRYSVGLLQLRIVSTPLSCFSTRFSITCLSAGFRTLFHKPNRLVVGSFVEQFH